jgi:hypothetical protein
MNRIRQIGDQFQVLITPHIPISPDSSLLIGNWDTFDLNKFKIISFDNLSDAQYTALQFPDINWTRMILNHQPIYQHLNQIIKKVIEKNGFDVHIIPHLMNQIELKNAIFDRVTGSKKYKNVGLSDVITFTIINPWTSNLKKLASIFGATQMTYYSYNSDDLKIRKKKIIDNVSYFLSGLTPLGTTYQIRLLTPIIHQWNKWSLNNSNRLLAQKMYDKYIKMQKLIDTETI